jgi:DNA repair exonuclease SbcCD nuclease subunit
MLPASEQRIQSLLNERSVVLDIGGWAKPFARADWVLDLMPYETRGLYGPSDPEAERFDADTWIQRDICDREPFPFADGEIDFVICSHTLEDIRDPIWVCSEIVRVAKAGYIEGPSRLEEQSYGVQGPWVGWSHHRWLMDVSPRGIEFVAKPHVLHGRSEFHFPDGFAQALAPEKRVDTLFWEESFEFGERIFLGPGELDAYLEEFVAENEAAADSTRPSALRAMRRRVRRLQRRA